MPRGRTSGSPSANATVDVSRRDQEAAAYRARGCFRSGRKVPQVLLSGNHAEIEKWRRKQSLFETKHRRPDMFSRLNLTEKDKKLLNEAEEQAK